MNEVLREKNGFARTERETNGTRISPGENVLVRNFPNKQKWISGYIVKKIAERTYIIDIGHREIQRHIDHIVKCSVEIPNENNHDEYM